MGCLVKFGTSGRSFAKFGTSGRSFGQVSQLEMFCGVMVERC